MTAAFSLVFDHQFNALGDRFYTRMQPEAFSVSPYLIHANPNAAALIDLDPATFSDSQFPLYFSGNQPLPGSDSLAMVYDGHQFGIYAGQLGDGRALLLGQVRNGRGEWWDIQLKGAGRTPYSRFGDGRAVLRSSIREYLCSEAMHGLGIPTTRALSIVGTNEKVIREKREPGAILTRLSPSHIRFGHFEHFFYTDQPEAVIELADHVMRLFYPHLIDEPDRYRLWFNDVVDKTACLIAEWQSVGFAHGVMNTDNMSILGLTIDYGPFGFMDAYDPDLICNHSDHEGRYAFGRQPYIGLWNLHALAHALQPLISWDESTEILATYDRILKHHYERLMMTKLGLSIFNESILIELLTLMARQGSDYTLTFRYLTEPTRWLTLFKDPKSAEQWLTAYLQLNPNLAQLNKINPKYVLRNWVAELAIRDAEDDQDYRMIETVLMLMQAPYDDHPDWDFLAKPAPEQFEGLCVSCSS